MANNNKLSIVFIYKNINKIMIQQMLYITVYRCMYN